MDETVWISMAYFSSTMSVWIDCMETRPPALIHPRYGAWIADGVTSFMKMRSVRLLRKVDLKMCHMLKSLDFKPRSFAAQFVVLLTDKSWFFVFNNTICMWKLLCWLTVLTSRSSCVSPEWVNEIIVNLCHVDEWHKWWKCGLLRHIQLLAC